MIITVYRTIHSAQYTNFPALWQCAWGTLFGGTGKPI